MRSALDKINKNIIRLLFENSRRTIAELSKLVHLSAPAVKERIEKLEEQNIIAGYSLKANTEALGYVISGFVHADVIPGKESAFRALLQSCDAITECYNVTGEKAYIFRFSVRAMSELDELLEELETLSKTETSLILSETIVPRLPKTFIQD